MVATRLLTLADFEAMGEEADDYEVYDGVLVRREGMGERHGQIGFDLGYELAASVGDVSDDVRHREMTDDEDRQQQAGDSDDEPRQQTAWPSWPEGLGAGRVAHRTGAMMIAPLSAS